MEAAPVSIFANLDPQAILNRLAMIKVNAVVDLAMIPTRVVHSLFTALEGKLPEVGLAIKEIPAGPLSPDAIEDVLLAAEAAMDARNAYLAAA